MATAYLARGVGPQASVQNPYPRLREVLAPEFRSLSPEGIEQLVRVQLGPGIEAADLEGFFDDVGKAFSSAGRAVANVATQAAPYVARAVPGIVQGAASGAALGPYGMIAGGLLGGVSSALQKPGQRGSPAGGAPMPGAASPLGALGALAPVLAGGSPAAGQLLSLLGRPEVSKALTSMLMGGAGARTIPVGGAATPVPVSAITNLLGVLANRASEEYASGALADEAFPAYLQGYAGEMEGDPNVAEFRAARLMELLSETAPESVSQERVPRVRQYTRAAEALDDAVYDELDLADLASMYENGELDAYADW